MNMPLTDWKCRQMLVAALVLTLVMGSLVELPVATMARSQKMAATKCQFVMPEAQCSNLLHCARLCEQNTACDAVVYNGETFKITRKEENVCKGSWTRMVSLNSTTGHVTGDIGAVIQAILAGAQLETVHTSGQLYVKQFRVATAFIRDGVLCTQSEPLDVPSDGSRKVFMFCTSGYNRQLLWYLFPPFSVNELEVLNGDQLDWYVQAQPCSTQGQDPEVASLAFTAHGASVRVLSQPHANTYVQRKISTSCIGSSDLHFQVQPNHATVEYSGSQNAFVYQSPYTVQSIMYDFYNGNKVVVDHPLESNLSTTTTFYANTNFDIMLDTNWHMVYQNNQNGNATLGNLCNLRKKVESGQRVKVFTQGMLFEPIRVYIVNEHVFALCHVDYIDESMDTGNMTSMFAYMVSTQGWVEKLVLEVTTGAMSVSSLSATTAWYVEQVDWTPVYDSEYNQDHSALQDHLVTLSSLRFLFRPDTSPGNYTLIMDPGPVIKHMDTGLFQARLPQVPSVTITHGTAMFRQTPVLDWILYRVNISPTLGKLMQKTRPHGTNDPGIASQVQGHLVVLKQTP